MKTEWTTDTLKEHFDRILEERDAKHGMLIKAAKEAVDAAFKASEAAITKSEANADKWRASANEWRAAMMDREQKFAGKIEMDVQLESITKAIVALQRGESRTDGVVHAKTSAKVDSAALWGLLITVGVAVLGSLGSLIFYLATKP